MRYTCFIVSGYVQGVGFREHTRRQASRIGIKGWVANRADGSVEVCCRGEQVAIEAFSSWLRHGPPMARVDSVRSETVANDDARYREIQLCDGFSIWY